MKLCIDPGHGGRESGGVGLGNVEKEEVLAIGLTLAHLAREKGIEVLLTRNHDVYVSITTRWQMANYWGADLFLSIHTNAAGGRGIEVLYGKPQYAPMAKRLARKIAEATGWPLRRDEGGYYRPSGVGVIKNTLMPALLSESGFIDYPEENAAMDTDIWTYQIAKAHLDFVCEQFGIENREEDQIMYIEAKELNKGDPIDGWYRYNVPACYRDWYVNISYEGAGKATVRIWANPQDKSQGSGGYDEHSVENTNAPKSGLHMLVRDAAKGLTAEWSEISIHSDKPITANVGRGQ